MGIHDSWVSKNPSGVVINPGWYALAEAILTNRSIYRIMHRWFGIKEEPVRLRRKRKHKKHPSPISDQIVKMYRANKKLRNIEIAEIIGCTPRMVCIALRKIGIRRNRWDGHKSKDPRYSKKRRAKHEHFSKTVENPT